jgi:hypothetical protein
LWSLACAFCDMVMVQVVQKGVHRRITDFTDYADH